MFLFLLLADGPQRQARAGAVAAQHLHLQPAVAVGATTSGSDDRLRWTVAAEEDADGMASRVVKSEYCAMKLD